ncbi:hypothetical protein FEM48_Zijuj07G0110500 [Ziziphus jujuba var. spinosa]|uniref:Uncharacterized protein n=1 Tax=Ziziphus jujuba var. spinosa TaxID=714518 RepID=A0A978V494_ZIZJJ|nr:hypothetical protein FEM48_Zijuj07G0110500 [Ziziphus jujuba var. spinosa]
MTENVKPRMGLSERKGGDGVLGLKIVYGISTPRWQGKAETEPRTGSQTAAYQVLVPKQANPDGEILSSFLFNSFTDVEEFSISQTRLGCKKQVMNFSSDANVR